MRVQVSPGLPNGGQARLGEQRTPNPLLPSSNLGSPAKAPDAEAVEARDCKSCLTQFESGPALQRRVPPVGWRLDSKPRDAFGHVVQLRYPPPYCIYLPWSKARELSSRKIWLDKALGFGYSMVDERLRRSTGTERSE